MGKSLGTAVVEARQERKKTSEKNVEV